MRYCRRRERPGGLWSCGRILLLVLSVCSLGSAVAAQGDALPGYKVIVNGDVEGSAVPRALLADIFLKKIKRWGNGQAIAVVDQSLSSDVRQQFTRDVLGQGSSQVLNYWGKQIDKGVWPPKAMESDVDVLTYVAGTPGAIGYVSEDTALGGRNIKVLEVRAASDVPSP
jgi:ABC-type phosphate transport system substrate-binding protein